MKKLLIGILIFLAVCAGAWYWAASKLGLSSDMQAKVEVATGLSAKLACSGYHLSGIPEQALYADISSYAPITPVLSLEVDQQNVTTASLLGAFRRSATYRPGLGCTLDIANPTNGAPNVIDQLAARRVVPGSEPWPAGNTVNSDSINPTVQETLERLVATDNANNFHTRAMLVVHNGQIVAESYADGFNSESQLMGWSMGKSVTSMLLGRLFTQTQFDVQETNLFEAWQQDERKEISLENLLQMSSGLDFDETYAPGSDATYMLFAAPNAATVALKSDLAFSPGSHFSYSSGTTNLLMLYLANQLGGPQALLDFLYDELLAPLNLAHTTFEADPSGILVGSSYIYASARDWAKLGLVMANQGVRNGQPFLSPDWVKASINPNHSDNDPRYGYQFWLNRGGDSLRWPELPEDAYAMSGNRAQSVMIVPSRNTVLVRLGWTAGRYPMQSNFAEILSLL